MTRLNIDCRFAGILAIALVSTGCAGNDAAEQLPAAQLYEDTVDCMLALREAVRRGGGAEGDQLRLTHQGIMVGQAYAFGRLTGRSPDQVEDEIRELGDAQSERFEDLFESANINDVGDRLENYPPCKAIPFPGSAPL